MFSLHFKGDKIHEKPHSAFSLSAPSIAGCAPIRGLFLHCPGSVPVGRVLDPHKNCMASGDQNIEPVTTKSTETNDLC